VDVEGLEAMKLGTEGGQMFEDDQADLDDSSDVEDTNLKENDALILVAKTEEDFASLEVYVYEQVTGNLFVHHDIALPTFPLCLSHGTMNHEGNDGNYVAIGSFSPGIEVWNLDVLDALEPTFILGGEDTSAADDLMKLNMARASSGKALKKKKASSNGGLKPGSHTDAVMSLAWNNVHRQVLASGSADCTVKVWDITQVSNTTNGGVAATFSHHRGKVQSLAWHPTEGTILATGAFDQTVALVDARTNDGSNVKKVKLPADCEAIAWDPFNSQYLSAASEDGTISCWDVRKFGEKPVWTFVAHEFGGVSDMSYNS
jgi:periodic tryptophan protein 1